MQISDLRLFVRAEGGKGRREEVGGFECYEERRRQSSFFVGMLLVGAFFW